MSSGIAVVIPTLGERPDVLARTLDCIGGQSPIDPGFDVIVVADARSPSPADLTAVVARAPIEVDFKHARLPGASAGRNLGWRSTDRDLVLFLGDDVLAAPDLLAEHAAWHERDPAPTTGVLGHVRWADELRVTPFMRWLEHGIQFDYPNIDGDRAGWGRFYTANVSVKRAMLERVDGFDEERLPFLYEDLDLALRMSVHGFELFYNREAVGQHLHAVDVESWRRRAAQIAVAEHRFVALHPEVPAYFHKLFCEAAQAPPAKGRGARLLRFVSPSTPWIGPRAWTSADLYFRQLLAPAFLAEWESVSGSAKPTGSCPGGPK